MEANIARTTTNACYGKWNDVLMSRKGNCYDNAPIESFWGMLKTELLYHCRYETCAQAIQEITAHIEIFINRQRWHSKLGNLTPPVFAQRFELRWTASIRMATRLSR